MAEKDELKNEEILEKDETTEVEVESAAEVSEKEKDNTETTDASTETSTEDKKGPNLTELMSEFDNKYKRLQADFENFKRRTNQEKTQLATFIKAEIIEDFLPIIDNFDRALATPVTDENKALYEGLQMVQQNLFKMLEKHGLTKIEALGQPFDPNLHQAVMRGPSDEYEDDIVMEVLQTGYAVDGKTVRPAMVKVVAN